MNIRSLVVLSLFFVLSIAFLTNGVNGQTYYNWLESSSFSSLSDYCEDGSFESGAFLTGNEYGNWSGTGDFQASPVVTGSYSLELREGSPDEYATYTLAGDPILGADIEELSYYAYHEGGGGGTLEWEIHYDDATSDSDWHYVNFAQWDQYDITDEINVAKYVDWIKLEAVNYGGSGDIFAIDDVVLMVNDENGQTEITYNTSPWYLSSSYVVNNFGYINTVLGRLDSTSVQFSGSVTYHLIQDIDYLPVNNVHFIDAYVYTNGSDFTSYGFTCKVIYADRTTDTKTIYPEDNDETWEYLNWGQAWLHDDKLIIQVHFYRADSSTFLLDDFGVWADVQAGLGRFSFTVSPNPIDITSVGFDGYATVEYTINGFVYNSTGGLSENGTWQLTDSFGLHNGNITEGLFTFDLDARSGAGSENLGFVFIIDSEVVQVTLTVNWYSPGDSEPGTDFYAEDLAGAIVILGVIFIPGLMLGAMVKSMMGFIAGSVIGTIAGTVGGVVPFYALILIGVLLVVILFASRKF